MVTRTHDIFTTVTIEGALLPPDILRRVAEGDSDIDGLHPESYHLYGERLNEATNRAWNRLCGAWQAFQQGRDRLPDDDIGTTLTRERWLLILFSALDYGRLDTATAVEIDGKSYPISHRYKELPVHLLSYRVDLDRRTKGVAGAATGSPHSLLQVFLNRDDNHLWGIVSNGLRLRLLRDNLSLTRQAYIEFDLEAMMEGDVYSDFVLLYLLCHQSRVEQDTPADYWLETWRKTAEEQGKRALDDLRDGVERAIIHLGAGFIDHPHNMTLRDALQHGKLHKQDYYRQLLRLVYRMLFLFVAEDRDLLHSPGASDAQRERYTHYSTDKLRSMSETFRGTRHHDLYESLRLLMRLLGEERDGADALGLPTLGSFLFSDAAMPDIIHAKITNRDLLEAVRAISTIADPEIRRLRRVDFKNLGSEELGSVYESLLELHPDIHIKTRTFELKTAGGNERKTTGSYYTPTSLINALLDSALDPVLDEAAGQVTITPDTPQTTRDEIAERILNLSICDPACGSGHFLIAAAGRIARRLAQVRSGEDEPTPDHITAAKRDVIASCIYGVDLNPMAVELCKVNLWLESIDPGRPLTFLDSRIRQGNSLLGTTPALMAQGIPEDTFPTKSGLIEGDDYSYVKRLRKQNRDELQLRQEGIKRPGLFDAMPTDHAELSRNFNDLARMSDDDLAAVRAKEARFHALANEPEYVKGKFLADLWCAAFVWHKDPDVTYTPFSPHPPTPSPSGRRGDRQQNIESYRAIASETMRDIARDLRQRQTSAEERLWEALRKRRLDNIKFRRQHPVAKTAFVVDFFTYENNIIVELDGSIHNQQQQEDKLRQQALEERGYTVIRFSNDEIFNNLKTVLATILQTVKSPPRPEGEGDTGGEGIIEYPVPPVPTDRIYRQIEDNPLADRYADIRRYVRYLADRYDFFHWHMTYPNIFDVDNTPPRHEGEGDTGGEGKNGGHQDVTGWDGGFSVVLGNPPWERIKLQEKEWFAERHPQIANAPRASVRRKMIQQLKTSDDPADRQLFREFLEDKRKAAMESFFARNSGAYPLTGRGDINTYPLFAEKARHVIDPAGQAGIIVPSGIATDATTQYFFNDLMQSRSLQSFYDFENRDAIFPGVHRSYKFALVTMTGAGNRAQQAEFVFFAHNTGQLQDDERRFTLTADEIAMLNPNTGTMATFRSQRDAEITKTIYRGVPVLIDEKEDADNVNPWGIKFSTMFHMSGDSDKFRTREDLQSQGYHLEGNHFVKSSPPRHEGEGDSGGEGKNRHLPLYEAKMIHQFDHRFASYTTDTDSHNPDNSDKQYADFFIFPRYWVDNQYILEQTEANWLFAFRKTARATDARTLIATIIPASAVNDKAPIIFPTSGNNSQTISFLANLNTYVCDFAARQKVGGTDISFFYLEQFPIIPPHTYTDTLLNFIVPRVLELTYTARDLQPFAQDVGYHGAPFIWDDERRFWLRAELDALYFHLYQIPREDVAYIMETFPIVKRKDIAATAGTQSPFAPAPDDTGQSATPATGNTEAPLHEGEGFGVRANERDSEDVGGYYRTKQAILAIYDEMAQLPTMDVPAPKSSPLPEGEGLGVRAKTISVPDVAQYQPALDIPPADPRAAHDAP